LYKGPIIGGYRPQNDDEESMIKRETEPETPANIDAEKSILGAVLLDNADHILTACLDADDFFLDSHRRIFLRMGELIEAQSAVDIVTMVEELRAQGEIETVGGRAYLFSLTEGLPRRPSVKDYVRIVKAKSLQRRLIAACESAIKKAYAGESGFTIIEVLRERLEEIDTDARRGLRPSGGTQ
jgi:replicative DNA helicase